MSASKEISAVGFSFYESSEVKKLSAKHIVNPILFDAMSHPNPGSLYDTAMGPIDKSASYLIYSSCY